MMHLILWSTRASLCSTANSSITNFCGEGAGGTWREWGSYWLVAICFCVSLFVMPRCEASTRTCPPASCLPKKSAKQIEHTASSEERFQLYLKIAQDQISRLRRELRNYRPWKEMPPSSGFPPHVPWGDIAPELFLNVVDCAWDEMRKELIGWRPQGRNWRFKVIQIHHRVTEAYRSLQDVEALAWPIPGLQSRIQISRSRTEEVEAELRGMLDRVAP